MNKEKRDRLEAAMDYMERATARDTEAKNDSSGYPIFGDQKEVLAWMIKNNISVEKLEEAGKHALHEAQYAKGIYDMMLRDGGFIEKSTAKLFAATYVNRYNNFAKALLDYKARLGVS